jgi:hypothetical protein
MYWVAVRIHSVTICVVKGKYSKATSVLKSCIHCVSGLNLSNNFVNDKYFSKYTWHFTHRINDSTRSNATTIGNRCLYASVFLVERTTVAILSGLFRSLFSTYASCLGCQRSTWKGRRVKSGCTTIGKEFAKCSDTKLASSHLSSISRRYTDTSC